MKTPTDGDTLAVEFAVVGFDVVDQQTPAELRLPHPSEVIFPLAVAELFVMLLIVIGPITGVVMLWV